MKLTDGLFHRVFDEVAAEYSDIQAEHLIVDIGMARLANAPQLFDVIVTPNLYGDILSDIAAEISGSVGLAGSANIGDHFAMFEAVHGSAPTIAGQNIANPSGLLLSAVSIVAIVYAARRFFDGDHRMRWPYAFVGSGIIVLLLIQSAIDVVSLATGA